MNNQQDRKDLEQFCRDFLNERNRNLYNVIDNYRHIFAQIDIQQLNLTQETFDSSFKSICRKLFNIRTTVRFCIEIARVSPIIPLFLVSR